MLRHWQPANLNDNTQPHRRYLLPLSTDMKQESWIKETMRPETFRSDEEIGGGREDEVNSRGRWDISFHQSAPWFAENTWHWGGGEWWRGGWMLLPPHHLLFLDVFVHYTGGKTVQRREMEQITECIRAQQDEYEAIDLRFVQKQGRLPMESISNQNWNVQHSSLDAAASCDQAGEGQNLCNSDVSKYLITWVHVAACDWNTAAGGLTSARCGFTFLTAVALVEGWGLEPQDWISLCKSLHLICNPLGQCQSLLWISGWGSLCLKAAGMSPWG